MVPATVTIQRSKTASIIALAIATIVVAIWLVPRGTKRKSMGVPLAALHDPCAVVLSSRLTSTHVLVGHKDEHLAVTLRAPSCGQTLPRPPMTIAVVIDRSGSMMGAPIEDARDAAHQLIDQLAPTDAFSIVTYSTGAELVAALARATDAAKRAAHRAIDAIDSDGGTNISAGLELAQQSINAGAAREGVRRLVLISDGQANEGTYDRAGLTRIAATTASSGISISTVGVGREFSEVTMTDLASAGRGNYYFVEDTARLAETFAAELGSAGKIVAADAELAITPAAGIEILEVYGYGAHLDGSTWFVPVADLAAGETRKIVARVRVRAEARGTLELATARLAYRPIDAHRLREVVATARAEVTGDVQLVRAGIDTGTVRLIEEAQTAKAIDEANMVYLREGYDGARAVLDTRMREVEARAADLGDGSIADKSVQAAELVKRNFAAAPSAAGPAGSVARKANYKAAFDLAR
jgi:Ca-activated chloride channel family protein